MGEICMDEEYLEAVSPILQEFVVPSNIALHLTSHLGQDDIKRIIKLERKNGTANAARMMVRCLQKKARTYYEDIGQNQDRPIFTALVDILSERGYEVVNRFLRQPEEITGWKEHLQLFEVYLPQLSKINVNEFIIELISADLIDVGTPEYGLVMKTLKHEGNEMAILEILNHIWRKKINWSERFIDALKNHMESGGVVDEDMIATMESKILSNDNDQHLDTAQSLENIYFTENFNLSSEEKDLKNIYGKTTPTSVCSNLTDALSEISEERNSAYPSSEAEYEYAPMQSDSLSSRFAAYTDIYDVLGKRQKKGQLKKFKDAVKKRFKRKDEAEESPYTTLRLIEELLFPGEDAPEQYQQEDLYASLRLDTGTDQSSGIQEDTDFRTIIQNSIQEQSAVAEFKTNMEYLHEFDAMVDKYNECMKFSKESMTIRELKATVIVLKGNLPRMEKFNKFMKTFKEHDAERDEI